jgi:signal peptide peptidase SppA
MNFPFVFQALYCEPLCLELSMFRSMHQVVMPRILGEAGGTLADLFAADPSSRRPSAPVAIVGPGAEVNHTAIIAISGVIASGPSSLMDACFGSFASPDAIAAQLVEARDHPDIRTIVLKIASPGGRVSKVPELSALVASIAAMPDKTVYSFCDDRMASAAYWIGSQANEIYVTPSSITGSIGTYLALLDETVKMEKKGEKLELFSSGTHKALGTPGKALTDADREYLQGTVDKINGQFTGAVKAARPQVSKEALRDAKTYDGEDAVAQGLADGVVGSWLEFLALL